MSDAVVIGVVFGYNFFIWRMTKYLEVPGKISANKFRFTYYFIIFSAVSGEILKNLHQSNIIFQELGILLWKGEFFHFIASISLLEFMFTFISLPFLIIFFFVFITYIRFKYPGETWG